jgi:ribosomal protein L21
VTAEPVPKIVRQGAPHRQNDSQIVASTPCRRSRVTSESAPDQGKKIRVFKMKRRKHYRRTRGHRTLQTRVRVTAINT